MADTASGGNIAVASSIASAASQSSYQLSVTSKCN